MAESSGTGLAPLHPGDHTWRAIKIKQDIALVVFPGIYPASLTEEDPQDGAKQCRLRLFAGNEGFMYDDPVIDKTIQCVRAQFSRDGVTFNGKYSSPRQTT